MGAIISTPLVRSKRAISREFKTEQRCWDEPAPPRFFLAALGFYVLIVVTRLHESVTFLQPLYLGKVSTILLFVAAWQQLDRTALRAALTSSTARCLWLITALAIISVPGSFWPHESVNFLKDQWPLSLLLFVCVAAGFANVRVAYRVLTLLTIGATLAAGQLLLGAGMSIAGRAYVGGGGSSTYDPNDSATLFVMALPYALLIATRAGKWRWAAVAAIPMLLAALIKTGSRGGIVALLVLFLIAFATGDKRRRIQCVGLAVVAIGIFAIMPHGELMQRFNEVFGTGTDYNFDSRDGRLQIWKRGIGLMLSNPLLGVGVGTYEIANGVTAGSWHTAHNAYIQIGVELGILGFAAFLGAIASSVVAVRKAAAFARRVGHSAPDILRSHISSAALASLAAVLVCAVFLSMAYSAMTIFALAATTGLGIRQGIARRGRPTNVAEQKSVPQSGWRTVRSAALQRRHIGE